MVFFMGKIVVMVISLQKYGFSAQAPKRGAIKCGAIAPPVPRRPRVGDGVLSCWRRVAVTRGKECQGAVFGLLHQFALAGTLVVNAAQVQYAVYDDSVQLASVVAAGKLLGVGAHGVEADEEVAAQAVALAVVEGDDVRVVVVPEVLPVHLEYALVGAEDVGDVAHALAVALCHGFNPFGGLLLPDGGHGDAVGLVGNHIVVSSFYENVAKVRFFRLGVSG